MKGKKLNEPKIQLKKFTEVFYTQDRKITR